jgi:hypothetical protein
MTDTYDVDIDSDPASEASPGAEHEVLPDDTHLGAEGHYWLYIQLLCRLCLH